MRAFEGEPLPGDLFESVKIEITHKIISSRSFVEMIHLCHVFVIYQ